MGSGTIRFPTVPPTSPRSRGRSKPSQHVVADFGKLPAEIPAIAACEWGTNVNREGLNDGFTHCFTLTFMSDADRDDYLVHPAHQRFVSTLGGALERSLVLDYWTRS